MKRFKDKIINKLKELGYNFYLNDLGEIIYYQGFGNVKNVLSEEVIIYQINSGVYKEILNNLKKKDLKHYELKKFVYDLYLEEQNKQTNKKRWLWCLNIRVLNWKKKYMKN